MKTPIDIEKLLTSPWEEVEDAVVTASGYVGCLSDILNRDTSILERCIGYKPGRLAEGYVLLALFERVSVGDFVWADTTEYSGGRGTAPEALHRFEVLQNHARNSGEFANPEEWIDITKTADCMRLNDRSSPDRIVKVAPRRWGNVYPDAEPAFAIRQWQLLRQKKFVPIANVPANTVLKGGGTGASVLVAHPRIMLSMHFAAVAAQPALT